MTDFHHIPVLPREVVKYLSFAPGRPVRLIDGTIGGASHSALLLGANPHMEILGIDRDEDALAAAEEKLSFAPGRVFLKRGNYSSMFDFADELGWETVDAVLLDIGVSSPQLDKAERGFSWRFEGPLDMRMDNRSEITAARLLNRADETELGRIFAEYGEFRGAYRLAREIVSRREKTPFGSTTELVALCDEVLGKSRPGKLPAPTLVFQALRIAVNDELGELKRTLGAAIPHLSKGGRIAVISFHSLEDRIVKDFFRRESTDCLCPPGLPVCRCGHRAVLSVLTGKPITPDEAEIETNKRSACAKMRVAEKIAE